MKSLTRLLRLLPLCGLLLWLLGDAAAVRSAGQEALQLCAGSVIPALLPFLIVSDLLISLGLGQLLAPRLGGLMALYRLPGCGGAALLLGLTGGCPIGARTAAALFQTGQLTRAEACRLLTFCNNSNPVFLISVLGIGVFGSLRVGVWLWLIHLWAALLAGLFFRGKAPDSREAPPLRPEPVLSFVRALTAALSHGAAAMLSICVCVVFFYVLLTPLRARGGLLPSLLIGLTELFSLTSRLTPTFPGLVLAAGCSGWGGLSILLQTAAILEDSGLPLRPCILGKSLQGVLSALLAFLLHPWILP